MRPSEAATVTLGGGEGAVSISERDRPKLGMVLMTKRPLDLEQWLCYHRQVIGVERFYIQCEDTPELASLLLRPPWNAYVDATFVAKTQRDYFVQMDRQAVNVACCMPRARAAGVEWLLHIDDDELLHAPSGVGALWAALRDAPKGACDAHVKNLEAVAPDARCRHPFAECTTFVASTSKYSSYTNGKSFGRVGAPGLRAHGPHHFRCDAAAGGARAAATLDLPPAVAVVLHYESCAYERWTAKFSELADRHGHDEKILEKLPFPFYRSSLSAMLKVARAPEKDKGAAQDAAFRVWVSRKTVSEFKLSPKDAITVTVVKDAINSFTDEGGSWRADPGAPPAAAPSLASSQPSPKKRQALEARPPPPHPGMLPKLA